MSSTGVRFGAIQSTGQNYSIVFMIAGTAIRKYQKRSWTTFADIGSIGGGWLSSSFIKRGWTIRDPCKSVAN